MSQPWHCFNDVEYTANERLHRTHGYAGGVTGGSLRSQVASGGYDESLSRVRRKWDSPDKSSLQRICRIVRLSIITVLHNKDCTLHCREISPLKATFGL